VTMAVDENGEFGYRPLLKAMYGALVEMADSGFINSEDLRSRVIPTVGRSREDFLAPFAEKGRFEGLRVEEAEVFTGEDRIWSDFEQKGDACVFGSKWAAFSRASVFPSSRKAWVAAETCDAQRLSIAWKLTRHQGWQPRPSACLSRSARCCL